jgi:hypothetical protein
LHALERRCPAILAIECANGGAGEHGSEAARAVLAHTIDRSTPPPRHWTVRWRAARHLLVAHAAIAAFPWRSMHAVCFNCTEVSACVAPCTVACALVIVDDVGDDGCAMRLLPYAAAGGDRRPLPLEVAALLQPWANYRVATPYAHIWHWRLLPVTAHATLCVRLLLLFGARVALHRSVAGAAAMVPLVLGPGVMRE